MHRMKFAIAALGAAALVSHNAIAQTSAQTGVGRGGSHHWKSEYTIDGAKIAISYGRPSLRGRPEAQLMPHGAVWRTGADTATRIVTDKTLKFGAVTLAPGTYTINTLPGATEWQIIFGRMNTPGQWGVPYNASLEIGRTTMTSRTGAPMVEQLTIHVTDTPSGATLNIDWGSTRAMIPFTVEP